MLTNEDRILLNDAHGQVQLNGRLRMRETARYAELKYLPNLFSGQGCHPAFRIDNPGLPAFLTSHDPGPRFSMALAVHRFMPALLVVLR